METQLLNSFAAYCNYAIASSHSQAIFMFFQIFAYAFRPMMIKPDLVPKDGWIVLNWVSISGTSNTSIT
eukprot:6477122-Amphidinium_carterae.1